MESLTGDAGLPRGIPGGGGMVETHCVREPSSSQPLSFGVIAIYGPNKAQGGLLEEFITLFVNLGPQESECNFVVK